MPSASIGDTACWTIKVNLSERGSSIGRVYAPPMVRLSGPVLTAIVWHLTARTSGIVLTMSLEMLPPFGAPSAVIGRVAVDRPALVNHSGKSR